MNKASFIKLDNYKIISDGIWIPKDELKKLMQYYDNKYTTLYTLNPKSKQELQILDLKYKICRQLFKLIDNE